ncbi:hypothetical protein [Vibrio sp. HN007]|uniref:hypothetical protein n=1 Tax=Vibrio iocasae TaxID=3098914 RepID=UPI0035D50A98
MWKASFSIFLCALMVPQAYSDELSLNWDWTVSMDQIEHRESVFFLPANESKENTVNALLDVEARYKGWVGLFALSVDNLYSNVTSKTDSDFVVQELFTQGSISAGDTSFDYLLGKARIDWGVGYGYRPLDIFKPYRRNPVGIQIEEGAGTAMLSYFDMDGEWSLIYTDSSWNNQNGTELQELSEQQGVGARRYWFSGDSEYQVIAYYDDVRHGLVGTSWVTVIDSAWEVHMSGLYQRKFHSYILPASSQEPVTEGGQTNGVQGLLGLNWANESGNQVILEYWYDNRGWSKGEWDSAFSVVDALPDTYKDLGYSYANGFNHVNLVQHNIMLHWSLDGSALSATRNEYHWMENITPTFDIIYSPSDSGFIATQWLSFLVQDTGASRFEIELAARFYTGDSNSVYANLPDKHKVLLNLKGRF